MFNEEIVKSLSELAALNSNSNVSTELYLESRNSLAAALPCTIEELVDIIYDYESPEIVIEAMEILAHDRDPKYKVVFTDIMNAHQESKVSARARQLLFNVIVLETAGEYLEPKN